MIVKVSTKRFGELEAKSFSAKIKGKVVKGFVTKKNGKFYAYLNLCKHLPVTLDLNDDQFFSFDKSHLQCHLHGAMYEIETGYCSAGPCQGARLDALNLVEENGFLVIDLPESSS